MTSETADDGRQVKCPLCPMCGAEPPFIFDSFAQAFCPNPDCNVLAWTPWDTAAANLADMHEAEILETEREAPPTDSPA